jgi:hypothetical protein
MMVIEVVVKKASLSCVGWEVMGGSGKWGHGNVSWMRPT